MDQYPLRNIPDDLWQDCRLRTTGDGISIKDVIVRALELYRQRGYKALWSDTAFDAFKKARK